MGAEPVQVGFACEEEDGGAHGSEAAVAAGFSLGGLDESVESFEKTVGLLGLRPRGNAVEELTFCVSRVICIKFV